MIEQIDDQAFLDAFTSQEWLTVDADGTDFITSDQPLLENPGLDAAVAGRTVYAESMALSPSRLFIGFPKSWATDEDWLEALRVVTSEVHNMLIVSAGPKYLYSRERITDGKFTKLRKMVDEFFGVSPAADAVESDAPSEG